MDRVLKTYHRLLAGDARHDIHDVDSVTRQHFPMLLNRNVALR